jgi:hypothetical protein
VTYTEPHGIAPQNVRSKALIPVKSASSCLKALPWEPQGQF